MNIALIGYGKMGREVETLALQREHRIVLRVDRENMNDITALKEHQAEAAIEFSTPSAAFDNIRQCIDQGIPVVSGTTGWFDRLEGMKAYCLQKNGTFFYASNFSIGVNILFHLNRQLAAIMDRFGQYEPSVDETHHVQKLDAPSGTALVLAGDMIERLRQKAGWGLNESTGKDKLLIRAYREGTVPGTHVVRYDSETDSLELVHTAKNRKGFATGAIMAAEFLTGKNGFFGMNDLLALPGN